MQTGIMQLGFVVGDLEASAVHWQRHGTVGPFFLIAGARFPNWRFQGEAQDMTLDIAFAQDGDVMVELIRPHGAWPNVYGEAPPAPGEIRPHHHAYLAKDLDVAARQLGYGQPVTTADVPPRAALRYYDCRATLGLYVELITDCLETRQFFELSAGAAQDWDGKTDPLRKLDITF